MDFLVFKLTLTPLAVALAAAAGRRIGPPQGGWVAGIPFTSAAVAIFITLSHGAIAGSLTAAAILAATASQAAFALVYSVAATRLRWPIALPVAAAAFAGTTIGLLQLQPPPVAGLEIAAGAVALALSLMPRARAIDPPAAPVTPAWADVVARAVVAVALVVALTALATRLGPALAGLLSPLPIVATVLIVVPHRRQGGAAAIAACRGFLWALFAFAAFGFTLAQLLPGVPLAAAMTAALAAALVLQAATLLLRRRRRATPG